MTLPRLTLTLFLTASAAVAEPFSHRDWSAVLARHVDSRGYVNYEALSRDRVELDRYLAAVERTSPDSDPAPFPTDSDKLAFWINAYNAYVVKGALGRGPERESVWGDGLFGISFFTAKSVVVGGKTWSLKALEDEIVRGRFRDPRIHAALNCASKSCPRLPQQAFEGPSLNAELDAAMREFVAEARNVQVDLSGGTVMLSKIFDWFDDDFLAYERRQGSARPSQVDYVNRYRAASAQIPIGLDLEFFAYDKAINAQ